MDISLDGASREPLYIQLQAELRRRILSGVYARGARLPAARRLAMELHIGRNTVDAAYAGLCDEGLLRIEAGRGAFVAIEAGRGAAPTFPWDDRLTDFARRSLAHRVGRRVDLRAGSSISFSSLAPDHRLFEVELFRKGLNDALAREGGVLLGYGYTRGYEPLRQEILSYLRGKSLRLEGRDVLIVNGFRQGLELVSRLLLSPGDAVLVESPCYNGALNLFQALGARVVHVACDASGPLPQALARAIEEHAPKLFYAVPTYHNPTGRNWPVERRRDILSLATERALPILEDGFSEELRYRGESHPPLASLDAAGIVIYIGSFSKILFPGLRVGWIAAPEGIYETLLACKYQEDIHTPLLPQAGLYEFLRNRGLERHLAACRRVYRERLDAMQSALDRHMRPFATWEATEGGFSLWLTLREGQSRPLLARARERGVAFAPGDVFYADGRGGDQLRLGFSRVTPGDIEEGVRRLAAAARYDQGGGT